MSATIGAPLLSDLCKKTCILFLDSLETVGDLPYDVVKPVLAKIKRPAQLDLIERNSKQIRGRDEELWLRFIKRDIPNWQDKPHRPKDSAKWYELYNELIKDDKQSIEEDAAVMAAAMKGIQDEQAKRTSKVIEAKKAPRLPRMGGMRVEKSAKSPPSILEKVRKVAQQQSRFSHRNAALARPSHTLSQSATKVRRAPQSILYDYATEEANKPVVRATSSTSTSGTARHIQAPKTAAARPIADGPSPTRSTKMEPLTAVQQRRAERKRKLDELISEEPEASSASPPDTTASPPPGTGAQAAAPKKKTPSPLQRPVRVARVAKKPVDIFMRPIKKRKVA